jgi:hypothetical protein
LAVSEVYGNSGKYAPAPCSRQVRANEVLPTRTRARRNVSSSPKAEMPVAFRGGRFLGSTRRRVDAAAPSMAAIVSPASAIEVSSAVAATKLGGSV